MRKPFVYGVGGVVSADIAVPDHERELEFYRAILATGDAPLWREDLTNNLGTPVIGLGIRTPEYDTLPLQWMPHFQVADVAASVACAVNMGGKEIWHSKNDAGESQWAVLADQVGAAFGVIPVVAEETGSSEKGERFGCIAWLSLNVPDVLASREFYQHVIGWNPRSIETQNREGVSAGAEMLSDKGTVAAEIRQHIRQEAGIPSVWLIHLPVNDLAESLRRVSKFDGKVIMENAGAQCAVVRDPVGVYIALQAG